MRFRPFRVFLGLGSMTEFGPLIANPKCHIFMHAMGPNVASVVGTLVAAGTPITMLGR